MNPVIRAQLREFAKANNIEHQSQDTQFEVYSIFSILTGLLGESIEAYDVHLPGAEFGLDGIAVLVQGETVANRDDAEEKLDTINNPNIEFIFFQAKTSTSFDYGDISKFYDAVTGFFDGDLAGESGDVDDLIAAKDAVYDKGVGKRNPKISCYYVTTGNYEEPSKIEKLRSNFRTSLEEMNIFEASGIEVQFVGARELQQWYRAATSAVDVEIDFPRNVVMPPNKHVEEAYIGYVDAANLLKMCTMRGLSGEVIGINRAVFFDNIRDYDPKSPINKSIKESVRKDGGAEFVFRNNGVTAVAKAIDRTGDKFRLEDFQIVNGCQTSNVLYDLVFGNGDEPALSDLASKIQIPLRLIGSKDDEFISSIIIGTNRQNPVRDDQFWVLRPFMKSLEEYCRNADADEVLYFERRDNQYRGQQVERTRIVQPAVLMKAVAAALLFQPQRAARDYRGILAEYENAIFLDEHDVRPYHAVAYMYYRLEFLWRNQRVDSSYKGFRYYIMAGIGLEASGGQDVFGMKKGKVVAAADAILKLCRDENALVAAVQRIAHLVESRLTELKVESRERIRDTIRSETFANSIKERILADSA